MKPMTTKYNRGVSSYAVGTTRVALLLSVAALFAVGIWLTNRSERLERKPPHISELPLRANNVVLD